MIDISENLRLLIVEDDSVNCMILEGMLQKSALSIAGIEKSETLDSAMELLGKIPIDAVLLDLNLPDSTGLETLKIILKKHPQKPIIVITGEHDEQVGLEAISMGAQEYLLKGKFNVDSLVKSIRYGMGRKDSEERARQNERIFQTLISHLPQKILLKDIHSRFVYCNEKYAESTNLPIEELIGKTDMDLYPPDKAALYTHSDQIVLESDKTTEHFFRHLESDTEYITRVLKTVVKNERGQAEGILCVFEDFTDRIRIEEGLKNAVEELEASNQQLREMQSQLVQNEKLASIGQLAAGIAHEINNPMGFVNSNFSTLKKYIACLTAMYEVYEQFLGGLESGLPHDLEKELQKVREARDEMQIDYICEDIPELFKDSEEGMKRIIKIVKNLRDFSRIDQIEDFSHANLADCLQSTLVVSRNELKYATDIITHFDDIPDVYCNSGLLNQVFLNILVNAAQAIDQQGRPEKGTIEIKTYSDEDSVICQISDDGPGIPADIVSRIFDPFFTTKPAGKGTGLGLNVSYDIVVNKHKGQLLVDSQVGQGTTFTIKIPINLQELINQTEGIQNDCQPNSLICG